MRQASKKYGIGLFAVGALLVIAGGVMIPVVDWIVREQIKEVGFWHAFQFRNKVHLHYLQFVCWLVA